MVKEGLKEKKKNLSFLWNTIQRVFKRIIWKEYYLDFEKISMLF